MSIGPRRSALVFLVVAALALAPGTAGFAGADTNAAASGERLEGVVLDVGGTPASGAAVTLTGRELRREAPADSGGRFFLEAPPGVYLLRAAAGGIESAEIRIEIREDEAPPLVTVQLRPPVPVDGDVFASMPVAGRLEVFLAGENLLDGRFETGSTPVVTLGAPRTVTAGVRLARSPAP